MTVAWGISQVCNHLDVSERNEGQTFFHFEVTTYLLSPPPLGELEDVCYAGNCSHIVSGEYGRLYSPVLDSCLYGYVKSDCLLGTFPGLQPSGTFWEECRPNVFFGPIFFSFPFVSNNRTKGILCLCFQLPLLFQQRVVFKLEFREFRKHDSSTKWDLTQNLLQRLLSFDASETIPWSHHLDFLRVLGDLLVPQTANL